MITSISQGDIFLLPFPYTDLSASKPRPAIVISNRKVNGTDDIICALITSNQRGDTYSFKLEDKDVVTAMPANSEVRCHRLFTLEKSIIIKKNSHLHKSKHKSLIDKIISFIEPDSDVRAAAISISGGAK